MTCELVAHRGWMSDYPENTMPAFEQAIKAGAKALELDIQFSKDHVPMIIHDDTLDRTCDQSGAVHQLNASELIQISAGEPARFSAKYAETKIPRLSDLLQLISQHADVHLMVEIKPELFNHLGMNMAMAIIIDQLSHHQQQCIVISYNMEALLYTQQQSTLKTGLVLRKYDNVNKQQAQQLQPDFLICNYKKIDETPPWPGRWQWVLYEINNAGLYRHWQQYCRYIETANIGNMLKSIPTPT